MIYKYILLNLPRTWELLQNRYAAEVHDTDFHSFPHRTIIVILYYYIRLCVIWALPVL